MDGIVNSARDEGDQHLADGLRGCSFGCVRTEIREGAREDERHGECQRRCKQHVNYVEKQDRPDIGLLPLCSPRN